MASAAPESTRDQTVFDDADQFDSDTKARLIRQVDYYFSDENLPGDEHLLAKTGGDGNGAVSINHIMGFRRMREFKGKSKVRNALYDSRIVEIVDRNYIKRKLPLTIPLTVKPKLHEQATSLHPQPDKPWLTKNMMKPTGFEDADEKPDGSQLSPDSEDLYAPTKGFVLRIETAITLFCQNRKMHQSVRAVFSKWLSFGGFDARSRMFAGKATSSELDELEDDAQSKALRLQEHYVDPAIISGLQIQDGQDPLWYVDFVVALKAFISTVYMHTFDWHEGDDVHSHFNVFRSFYNYLITNGVCPEFQSQILDAREFCDAAELELARLKKVACTLPGRFNWACSTSFDSNSSQIQWVEQCSNTVSQVEEFEREVIVNAAASIFVNDERLQTFLKLRSSKLIPSNALRYEGMLGLEITNVQLATTTQKRQYEEIAQSCGLPFVKPLGTLVCKLWDIPHAAPKDLPVDAVCVGPEEVLCFYMENDILEQCCIGWFMEADVTLLKSGLSWIDRVNIFWPTFYVSLDNEAVRDWKEIGPPKRRAAEEGGECADPD